MCINNQINTIVASMLMFLISNRLYFSGIFLTFNSVNVIFESTIINLAAQIGRKNFSQI